MTKRGHFNKGDTLIMKTTVFLFHPNFANSRVNKALAAGLPGDIEVRDMYAL